MNPDAAGDFVLERGQSFAMLTQYCGQIVELPSADKIMQRVGWRFVGWTDSAWEAVKWPPGETLLAYYGLRLYAVWQRLTYNVSFNSNGGTPVSDKKGIGWSDRNVLQGVDTPTKVGYEFDGWYIVNPYSDRFDDSIDKVSNNTTYADLARYNGLTDETALANGIILYAKWLEKQATIYYRPVVMDAQGRFVKTTGGSLTVSSENIYAISTLTAPRGSQASSNTGYHFLGWYDAQGNLLSRSEKYIPTKSEYNLTGQYWGDANHSVYYALFEPNSYTIEFINNGGIGRIEAITVKYDEYRNLPVNDGQMARDQVPCEGPQWQHAGRRYVRLAAWVHEEWQGALVCARGCGRIRFLCGNSGDRHGIGGAGIGDDGHHDVERSSGRAVDHRHRDRCAGRGGHLRRREDHL